MIPAHQFNFFLKRCCYLLISLSSVFASAGHTDSFGEFLIFPNITSKYFSDDAQGVHQLEDRRFTVAEVDFFYNRNIGSLELLAEYFVEAEVSHLERLQLSWNSSTSLRVRLGRFYNPIGYHNTQSRHAAYLETAASNPVMMNVEDEGGVLPMHISGLLIDSEHLFDHGASLHSELVIGLGPELENNKLHELDILKPEEGSHKAGGTLYLSYFPDELSPSSIGMFTSIYKIPSNIAGIKEIKQTLFGAFAHWSRFPYLITGSLFSLSNEFTDSGTKDSFINAYIQPEYALNNRLNAYARVEGSNGASNDVYLKLFDEFMRNSVTAGLDYEIIKTQTIKLEIANIHTLDTDYSRVIFQWSTVIQ